MHEFAMCESIIKSIQEEVHSAKNVREILSVTIVIGGLHNIVEDNMQFGFEVLARKTILEGAKLIINEVEIVGHCDDCGSDSIIENSFFYCEECGSGNLTIIKGKELYIDNLEVEENE